MLFEKKKLEDFISTCDLLNRSERKERKRESLASSMLLYEAIARDKRSQQVNIYCFLVMFG